MGKLTVKSEFNRLRRAFPGLVRHAKPLGAGAFGLTAEYPDGSITKFFFRQKKPSWQEYTKRSLYNEVSCLKLFNLVSFNGIQIPSLLSDPHVLNKKDFCAYYRMTKIPGTSVKWESILGRRKSIKPAVQDYFRQTGRMLAQFHKATAKLPAGNLTKWGNDGLCTAPIACLKDDANKALSKVSQYLKKHAKPGFIHGDFHGENVLSDNASHTMGLIDFGRSGRSKNIFVDFCNIPDVAMPYFIDGYEQESRKKIDPNMATMTNICLLANYISYLKDDVKKRNKAIRTLNGYLAKVSYITGYTPPTNS